MTAPSSEMTRRRHVSVVRRSGWCANRENFVGDRSPRNGHDRYGIAMSFKVAAVLAGVAVLGVITFRMAGSIGPLLQTSAGFALESRMSNDQTTTDATDAQLAAAVDATTMPEPAGLTPPGWESRWLPTFPAEHGNPHRSEGFDVPAGNRRMCDESRFPPMPGMCGRGVTSR